MPHPSEHSPLQQPLAPGEDEALAEKMAMFATASRVRLLWALVDGDRTVDELARATGMLPSAASHQLRLLRQARLVAVERDGRHARYRLFDHHVPDLLAAMRHHQEHADGYGAQKPASAERAPAR